MKKIIILGVTCLSVITLSACSSTKNSAGKQSTSKQIVTKTASKEEKKSADALKEMNDIYPLSKKALRKF